MWAFLLPSVLLIFMYGATFHHVWVGTRFKIVLVIVAFLLLANFWSIVEGIAQMEILKHTDQNNFDTIYKWDCWTAVSIMFG